MRHTIIRTALAALALLIIGPAFADGPGDAGPDVAAPPVRAAPIRPAGTDAAPGGRVGVIPLGDGVMSLNVPAGYRFYSAEEAHAFLQRNNAAAPSGDVFGLLAKAGEDVRAPGTWATVISYDPIGYVQPETAAGLSDANFETDVRNARQTQNRAFEGFAAAPSFNTETPYLVWAERAAAPGGGQGKDLRYEQKLLGRNGVACLTSIGSADQMTEIAAAAADLRSMVSFAEGQRHGDFQAASDQVSAYSVPGLVTGVAASAQGLVNVAATGDSGQTGFGGLSGYFPWIALGVVVLAGGGYMLMRRRDEDEEEEDAA
ncbi:MAG: DUF2167 domain-containing protein [Hyphomonadaceae bacterium]